MESQIEFKKYICSGCGMPFMLSPVSIVNGMMQTHFCSSNCYEKYIICPQSKVRCEFKKDDCDKYCWIKN